ncbi:MAG: uracil-DNA glycosylase [Nitrospirota bacterium]
MNDIESELLDIVTQVRKHLEYQKTLGVSSIEMIPALTASPPDETDAPSSVNKAQASATQTENVPTIEKPGPCQSVGLTSVREELGNCSRCKLHKGRKTIVFGEGNPSSLLVFVGEGPGYEEDQQGRPFVGAAGQLLTDIIVKGIKLKREDVYICNIVKCRPPNNRNPEPDEIAACEPFLLKQIEAINPKIIVALGNIAAKTLLKTGEGITSLRGRWQSYHGIPVMPTFHPAYLLRNPKDKALVWEDIKKVIIEMEKIQQG